jgi:hypothetical protein
MKKLFPEPSSSHARELELLWQNGGQKSLFLLKELANSSQLHGQTQQGWKAVWNEQSVQ